MSTLSVNFASCQLNLFPIFTGFALLLVNFLNKLLSLFVMQGVSIVFQENVTKSFYEILFCNFVVAWISSQLPEQKEGLFQTRTFFSWKHARYSSRSCGGGWRVALHLENTFRRKYCWESCLKWKSKIGLSWAQLILRLSWVNFELSFKLFFMWWNLWVSK